MSSNMTKAHSARRNSISSMGKKDHFYSFSAIYIFKLWINVSGNVLFKGGSFINIKLVQLYRDKRNLQKLSGAMEKIQCSIFSLTSGSIFSKLIQKSRNK